MRKLCARTPGARVHGARVHGALILFMLLAGGAEAHRLQLFATVEGGVVHGYGFFAGGTRAPASRLIIRDDQGAQLWVGTTDAEGAFTFRPSHASDLDLTVDAGDGHVARAHIDANRFAMEPTAADANAGTTAAQGDAQHCVGALPANLPSVIDSSVDRAVARQIAPLLEAHATAEGRARFRDIISGIAFIIGLTGVYLWARSRRGREPKSPEDKR